MNQTALYHCCFLYRALPRVLLGACIVLLFTVPADAAFPEKITEQGKAFTVRVLNLNRTGELQGTGSGFFMSKEGHVATNRHVVEDGAAFAVTFVSGDRLFMAKAELIAVAGDEDLAILRTRLFPGAKPATLAIGDASSNQEVMALGFPGILDFVPQNASGLEQVAEDEFRANKAALTLFTPSTFTGNVGKMLGDEAIAHSAKISEGNSGGPLMDVSGRVLGVNTMITGNQIGVDYALAVHSSRLAELARQHRVTVLLSSSKAAVSSSLPAAGVLLVVAIAALSVVTFLLVLRKPRAVLAGGLSRLSHRPPAASVPVPIASRQPQAISPPAREGAMILRGRDPAGVSYRLDIDPDAFRRAGGRLVIGRSRDLCQLHLPHDSVSRRHAALIWSGGRLCIEDLNSGNGTLVNGQPVQLGSAMRPLSPGERITLGEVELVFDVLG